MGNSEHRNPKKLQDRLGGCLELPIVATTLLLAIAEERLLGTTRISNLMGFELDKWENAERSRRDQD